MRVSEGFRWTCSWCGVAEIDKAGHWDRGRIYHFGCWYDYLDWLRNEEIEKQIAAAQEAAEERKQ